VSGIVETLFTPVQGRLLVLLYGTPWRCFSGRLVREHVRSGDGAIDRQLRSLVRAGLVTSWRFGRRKFYQADSNSQVFGELQALIERAAIIEPLRRSLEPLKGLTAAFLAGRRARSRGAPETAVDLVVAGRSIDGAVLRPALAAAEAEMERVIHLRVLSLDDWHHKRGEAAAFTHAPLREECVFVVGSATVLDQVAASWELADLPREQFAMESRNGIPSRLAPKRYLPSPTLRSIRTRPSRRPRWKLE
jgi:hypothetical protein